MKHLRKKGKTEIEVLRLLSLFHRRQLLVLSAIKLLQNSINIKRSCDYNGLLPGSKNFKLGFSAWFSENVDQNPTFMKENFQHWFSIPLVIYVQIKDDLMPHHSDFFKTTVNCIDILAFQQIRKSCLPFDHSAQVHHTIVWITSCTAQNNSFGIILHSSVFKSCKFTEGSFSIRFQQILRY